MEPLHDFASQIWWSGVAAVAGDVCVQRHVCRNGSAVRFDRWEVPLATIRRLVVIGAGKAVGQMAKGLTLALGEDLLRAKDAHGWLNVPAGTVGDSPFFVFHDARPTGVNEPTELAYRGTLSILELVRSAAVDDLCVCLLSGGASALLVAPAAGIDLEKKRAVTRLLSAAGAGIRDLNVVRRALSTVKGGGLAAACRASRLVTLVLSDVLGDPLPVIGSGPTFPVPPAPADARQLLEQYQVAEQLPDVVDWLRDQAHCHEGTAVERLPPSLHHIVVGNLALAMQAAAEEATRVGFVTRLLDVDPSNPEVESEAAEFVKQVSRVADRSPRFCFISGGEPVVRLGDPRTRGRGGRNQQFALAAGLSLAAGLPRGLRWVLLSAGTDGEDGVTEVAGAAWDERSRERCRRHGIRPREFLRRHDAYTLFHKIGGLFRTGPTGTNVCDLRVFLGEWR